MSPSLGSVRDPTIDSNQLACGAGGRPSEASSSSMTAPLAGCSSRGRGRTAAPAHVSRTRSDGVPRRRRTGAHESAGSPSMPGCVVPTTWTCTVRKRAVAAHEEKAPVVASGHPRRCTRRWAQPAPRRRRWGPGRPRRRRCRGWASPRCREPQCSRRGPLPTATPPRSARTVAHSCCAQHDPVGVVRGERTSDFSRPRPLPMGVPQLDRSSRRPPHRHRI